MRALMTLLFVAGQLFVTLPASGQAVPPPGIFRGTLIASVTPDGQLTLRTGAGQLFVFRFDGRTWVERDGSRISPASLRSGEILEVICDRVKDPVRYARTIHAVTFQSQPRDRRAPMRNDPLEFMAPRGDLTYSGIVTSVSDSQVFIRTRLDGAKTLHLRGDTRFLAHGSEVEPGILKPNTRVFIRAGKNLDSELEAYTIIWGEILVPDPQ
jgi:hypothetical protein